jgi:hypothetical protein
MLISSVRQIVRPLAEHATIEAEDLAKVAGERLAGHEKNGFSAMEVLRLRMEYRKFFGAETEGKKKGKKVLPANSANGNGKAARAPVKSARKGRKPAR